MLAELAAGEDSYRQKGIYRRLVGSRSERSGRTARLNPGKAVLPAALMILNLEITAMPFLFDVEDNFRNEPAINDAQNSSHVVNCFISGIAQFRFPFLVYYVYHMACMHWCLYAPRMRDALHCLACLVFN